MNATESDQVLQALTELESATASQLSTVTGYSVKKVSSALLHLKSAGKVFHVGEVPISQYRQVNLYSAVLRTASVTPSAFQPQTWLSPIGGF